VFNDISKENYEDIKKLLYSQYKISEKPVKPGTTESLELKTSEGKITVTYYNNHKLMFQSSPLYRKLNLFVLL